MSEFRRKICSIKRENAYCFSTEIRRNFFCFDVIRRSSLKFEVQSCGQEKYDVAFSSLKFRKGSCICSSNDYHRKLHQFKKMG